MDKNMIHIDDLVKQRLTGGEEREMPGSWSRMRDLLDKEMPQKKRVAGYYDWRRILSAATGMLLLSALSVGGYHVISTKFRDDNAIARSAANSPVASQKPSTISGRSSHTTPAKTPTVALAKPSGEQSSTSTGKSAVESVKPANTAKTNNTEKTVAISTQKAKTSDVAVSKPNPAPVKTLQEQDAPANTSHSVPVVAVAENTISNPSNNPSKSDENQNINKTENTLNLTSILPKENAESNEPVAVNPAQQRLAASGKEHRNLSLQPKPTNNFASSVKPEGTKSQMPAPQKPDLPKDSLSKLSIVQRVTINPLTLERKLNADTISLERVAIDRPALASNTSTEPVEAPAASIALTATDASEQALVPLSNFKVQSRKTSKWNTRSFDEVVRDVKFNLAQTKFYTGISAGGNSYMFGPNNIGGFQLGLFGLFMFGDTWGAMAELKYVHRFNGGSTLKDDYVNTKPATSGGYLQANVEHFFKFTTLQSIEMPIALRYAAGRLNLFGGLNLAYHFGINADEVTLNPVDSAFKPATSGMQLKGSQSVHYNDFRARFALGGVAGISYEVSPSIQLDLRATKNFWDNAYGLGAEQVSRQYYNAPSMQFSIFYRFSQKNQIPKAK